MKKVVVSKQDIKELTKMKNYDVQYSDDVIEAINMVSYMPSNVIQFGSSIFSNLLYAGDIDLYEPIADIDDIPLVMKSIVDKITTQQDYGKKYILGDIKAGLKREYAPLHEHIGVLKDGKILGYQPELFELFSRKYSDLGFTEIPQLTDKNIIEKWLLLHRELHLASVIRWSPNEISNLYKTENGFNMLNLKNAVRYSELDKIDLYFFCESKSKFVEITNLLYETPKTQKIIQYEIGLNGLGYYYLQPQNILKYLKRYYSYERMNKNYKFMKVVSEFLEGNINLLNSCNTDLKVLTTMLEFGYSVNSNLNYIHAHINSIISRLQNVYEIDISNQVFQDIKSVIDMRDAETIINTISPISEFIMIRVNEATLKFINENKIPILHL